MKIIEKNTEYGAYGMLREEIIVENEDNGKRRYVTEGWKDGLYSWRVGSVVELLSTDTLASLHADSDVEGYSVIDLALQAHDSDRVLNIHTPSSALIVKLLDHLERDSLNHGN